MPNVRNVSWSISTRLSPESLTAKLSSGYVNVHVYRIQSGGSGDIGVDDAADVERKERHDGVKRRNEVEELGYVEIIDSESERQMWRHVLSAHYRGVQIERSDIRSEPSSAQDLLHPQ